MPSRGLVLTVCTCAQHSVTFSIKSVVHFLVHMRKFSPQCSTFSSTNRGHGYSAFEVADPLLFCNWTVDDLPNIGIKHASNVIKMHLYCTWKNLDFSRREERVCSWISGLLHFSSPLGYFPKSGKIFPRLWLPLLPLLHIALEMTVPTTYRFICNLGTTTDSGVPKSTWGSPHSQRI